jgi:hypothetical protein
MIKLITADPQRSATWTTLLSRARGLFRGIKRPLRNFAHAVSNHYQPERHYMRGPGPKWREKHAHAGSDYVSPVRQNVPPWRCTVLTAFVFVALNASSHDRAVAAAVQISRSNDIVVRDDARASKHPAKGANAPFVLHPPQKRDE